MLNLLLAFIIVLALIIHAVFVKRCYNKYAIDNNEVIDYLEGYKIFMKKNYGNVDITSIKRSVKEQLLEDHYFFLTLASSIDKMQIKGK